MLQNTLHVRGNVGLSWYTQKSKSWSTYTPWAKSIQRKTLKTASASCNNGRFRLCFILSCTCVCHRHLFHCHPPSLSCRRKNLLKSALDGPRPLYRETRIFDTYDKMSSYIYKLSVLKHNAIGEDPKSGEIDPQMTKEEDCSICMEKLGGKSISRPDRCRHFFCSPCLKTLVETTKEKKCPMCRRHFKFYYIMS